MGRNGTLTYFESNEVTVIVQKTTEYTKYKVKDTEPAIIYFNIDALLDGELTASTSYVFEWGQPNPVSTAISAMRSGQSATDEVW